VASIRDHLPGASAAWQQKRADAEKRGVPGSSRLTTSTRSRRGTRSGWIFEAFLLLPKSRVCSPCCIGPDGQGLQHRGDGANVNAGNYCNRVGSSAEGTLLSVPMRIACRGGRHGGLRPVRGGTAQAQAITAVTTPASRRVGLPTTRVSHRKALNSLGQRMMVCGMRAPP